MTKKNASFFCASMNFSGENINDGNLTALIFFLKTKGRKRGYVEQIDNNVTSNAFEALMKELPDDEEDL